MMMKLLRESGDNISGLANVDFDYSSMESMSVLIEPVAYVRLANFLTNRVIKQYPSKLFGSVENISNNDIYNFFEKEGIQDKINSKDGIIILSHPDDKITTAFIKERKLYSLSCGKDCKYFHTFDIIQPQILNEGLKDFVNSEIIIPTRIGSSHINYSIDQRHTHIKKNKIKSSIPNNFETDLEYALSDQGIYF